MDGAGLGTLILPFDEQFGSRQGLAQGLGLGQGLGQGQGLGLSPDPSGVGGRRHMSEYRHLLGRNRDRVRERAGAGARAGEQGSTRDNTDAAKIMVRGVK